VKAVGQIFGNKKAQRQSTLTTLSLSL